MDGGVFGREKAVDVVLEERRVLRPTLLCGSRICIRRWVGHVVM